MKTVRTYVVLFLLYILQTALGPKLTVFGAIPDLMFVFAVCYAVVGTPFHSAVLFLVCGLLLDVSAGQMIGLGGIVYMYTGYVVAVLSERYFFDNLRAVLLWTFLATFVSQFLYCTLGFLIWGYGTLSFVSLKIIWIGIYNCIVALPFYFLFVQSTFFRRPALFD